MAHPVSLSVQSSSKVITPAGHVLAGRVAVKHRMVLAEVGLVALGGAWSATVLGSPTRLLAAQLAVRHDLNDPGS